MEAAILANPGVLVLDAIGVMHERVAVFDQRRLRSGAGHTDIPDLIFLTDHGDVVVVEVKRLSNPELRGRHVVSQVVSYAATLSTLTEGDLVRALTAGQAATWEGVCAKHFPQVRRPDQLATRFRRRLEEAELDLVIACDSAPVELADWVRAAGRQNALGFNLHVVEVTPLTPDGRALAAWVPRTALRTEIIHRTAVVVRTDGGAVHVEVKPDSAVEVEEAVHTGGRRDQREAAKDILAPLAAELHTTPDVLWAEEAATHRTALESDWSAVRAALADSEDPGPYLRGKKEDGFLEGRYGVNLVKRWRPSVFVGLYLLPYDHKQPPLARDAGGDFALILDVERSTAFDGDALTSHPLFAALRTRLRKDAGGWDFADHLAQPSPNRWHPLHLRRPLAEIYRGTRTPEERRERWLAAARDVTEVLLRGGELAELRRKFGS